MGAGELDAAPARRQIRPTTRWSGRRRRDRMDGRSVGRRRRPLAGADQQPGHRLPQHGACPPAGPATEPAATEIDDAEVVVVGDLTDAHHVVGSDGDTLYLRTERDAPRGRLVAVDLDRPGRRRGGRSIGQHEADVLVGRAPGRGVVRAALVVRRRAPDRDRRPRRGSSGLAGPARSGLGHRGQLQAIPAPRSSSVSPLSPAGPGPTGWTSATRGHRRDIAAAGSARSRCPAVTVSSGGAARPADGVDVPMTVMRRADLPAGPRPTLLYGYGGFDIPVLPGVLGDVRQPGSPPAACWRWRTCAAAASSVPTGTRPACCTTNRWSSTTCSAAPRS